MLNPTEVLADALGDRLAANYASLQRSRAALHRDDRRGGSAHLERIGSSDALYHSAEHTALVALVGQDILRENASGAKSPQRTGCTSRSQRCTTSATCAASAGTIALASMSSMLPGRPSRRRAVPRTPS